MATPVNPFRYFNSSPEVIRLVVMMYVKYPLSLRNVLNRPSVVIRFVQPSRISCGSSGVGATLLEVGRREP